MNSVNTSDRAFTSNRRLIKSGCDRLFAAIALLIFFPIMLVVALLINLRMGKPIIFSQPRPGKDRQIFNFYKFRTMTNDCDVNGNLLPFAQRLTPLGQLLRKTSLDELPQLWNVLKGDMSFVGPRPLLVQYLERYSPEQARRHEVIPGITGWAQVNGRNSLNWQEKFQLDIWYIDNWSLWLDLKIIFLTVLKVVQQDGVNQHAQLNMPEFFGNEESN